jgi:hypothetical protein
MKNIKNIIFAATRLISGKFAVAGGDDDLKNFRFGLKVTPSVNWLKPDSKLITGNGAAVKYGGGVILEFKLAKVASVQTGLQIDMDGGKIKYNNDGTNKALYFYNNLDEKIIEYNIADTSNVNYTHYQLNSRKYNITYVTLPIALKLKTKEIGSLTYFGQVGMNTSFRWKANANDELTKVANAANETKTKVDITKDINIVNFALNAGLGAEYNLSGSTSILFGLNYTFGFSNVTKKESKYIERKVKDATNTTSYTDFPQVLKSNAVVLTIGVLF